MVNDASSSLLKYWEYAIEHYGIPFGHYCVKFYSTICAHFTLFNVTIFLIKCVPTGIYMHKFIKNIYIASRERLKQKRIEIEDIKLQIQIVNTKLKLRDAEFAERAELLRRKVEQLCKVRKRVQEIIDADDSLRNRIHENFPRGNEPNCYVNNTPGEETNFFVELLNKFKYDQTVHEEIDNNKYNISGEPASTENSVYSSAHDENKPDYHVKIVKVTNVYKVAYLRHFIKQRKLRRANKQALLRKKMEKIKKLFGDWQQTLKMVIENKLSLVNLDAQRLEVASQEAMGDYSKPNFNNSLDSDSDCRNSVDSYRDEYCVSLAPNQYRPVYNDDLNMNIEVRGELYGCDLAECFNKYNSAKERHDCYMSPEVLFVVPEETCSQVDIKEIKNET